jgi:hypothetical protein
MNSSLKSGNVCHQSVQNLLSSIFISKSIKIIQNYNFACYFVWVCSWTLSELEPQPDLPFTWGRTNFYVFVSSFQLEKDFLTPSPDVFHLCPSGHDSLETYCKHQIFGSLVCLLFVLTNLWVSQMNTISIFIHHLLEILFKIIQLRIFI